MFDAVFEYGHDLPPFGDLMTRAEWLSRVKGGFFVDYDGFGLPAKDGKMANRRVYPSEAHLLPGDATHVVWFNK